jgi:hypothetical protein
LALRRPRTRQSDLHSDGAQIYHQACRKSSGVGAYCAVLEGTDVNPVARNANAVFGFVETGVRITSIVIEWIVRSFEKSS